MAQILAPYHNGMRLGQGFNSYTQQICLDNAVLIDNNTNRIRVKPYYVEDASLPAASGVDSLPVFGSPAKPPSEQIPSESLDNQDGT